MNQLLRFLVVPRYGIIVHVTAGELSLSVPRRSGWRGINEVSRTQSVGLVRGNENLIVPHMKVAKLNPYGLRKRVATHAVSGTTAAPSIPSIARRGEWSIGSVLDVYWHFGSVGDHYLGRLLCGLDPNDPNFAVLQSMGFWTCDWQSIEGNIGKLQEGEH